MKGVLQIIEQFPIYRRRVIRIAETAVTTSLHPVFSERAKIILDALQAK